MVKIVLGVDGDEKCVEPSVAETLLCRLRFPNPEVTAVHVITPWPYGAWLFEGLLTREALDLEKRTVWAKATSLVNRAAGRLSDALSGHSSTEFVRSRVLECASATEGILEQAKEADVIAVDGPHHSPLGAFLTGSVARSLVTGSHPHSLLLAKVQKPSHHSPKDKVHGYSTKNHDVNKASGPLRVVLATDHSPYADRCVTELVRLAPGGIAHMTVMTAYSRNDLRNAQDWLPDLGIDLAVAIKQSLQSRNENVLQKLGPILYPNNATHDLRVVDAPVHEAIAQTMEEAQADLLILGARGHGFVDRVTFGSVAFEQAMHSPYSLLILRATENVAGNKPVC